MCNKRLDYSDVVMDHRSRLVVCQLFRLYYYGLNSFTICQLPVGHSFHLLYVYKYLHWCCLTIHGLIKI